MKRWKQMPCRIASSGRAGAGAADGDGEEWASIYSGCPQIVSDGQREPSRDNGNS